MHWMVAVVGVWVVFGVLGIGLIVWMVKRIRTRRPRSSVAVWVALVVSAVAIFGVAGTVVGLVKAFGAAGGENVEPSEKARITAEVVSVAMNSAAVGALLWISSMVVFFVLTRPQEPVRSDSDG